MTLKPILIFASGMGAGALLHKIYVTYKTVKAADKEFIEEESGDPRFNFDDYAIVDSANFYHPDDDDTTIVNFRHYLGNDIMIDEDDQILTEQEIAECVKPYVDEVAITDKCNVVFVRNPFFGEKFRIMRFPGKYGEVIIKRDAEQIDPAENEYPEEDEDDIPETEPEWSADSAAAMEKRDAKIPYIIREEEFDDMNNMFDKQCLMYYTKDQTLVDEEEKIQIEMDIVGDMKLGFLMQRNPVLFVRNERMSTDFMIQQVKAQFMDPEMEE